MRKNAFHPAQDLQVTDTKNELALIVNQLVIKYYRANRFYFDGQAVQVRIKSAKDKKQKNRSGSERFLQ